MKPFRVWYVGDFFTEERDQIFYAMDADSAKRLASAWFEKTFPNHQIVIVRVDDA